MSSPVPQKPDYPHKIGGMKSRFVALTIGSVGVVYGDIGTSPLYAFREALVASTGAGRVSSDTVLGVLSLIFWSLILVVTLKYVVLLLRADNNGEGGTLSLTALAFRALGGRTRPVLIVGMVGAAMFYGSSFITPALSVMSAVEGLKVATPAFEPYVLPLTVMILFALFAVQSRGTSKIAMPRLEVQYKSEEHRGHANRRISRLHRDSKSLALAVLPTFHFRYAALWFHGNAEYTESAWHGTQARTEF